MYRNIKNNLATRIWLKLHMGIAFNLYYYSRGRVNLYLFARIKQVIIIWLEKHNYINLDYINKLEG